jgi:hypothetical protein
MLNAIPVPHSERKLALFSELAPLRKRAPASAAHLKQ